MRGIDNARGGQPKRSERRHHGRHRRYRGTSFRMRGIPNVGTYVDGIWQIGNAGLLTQEFVDSTASKCLRGPQGTMFGRDSTGGAIRIWTKRPAAEFGGNVTVDRRLPRSAPTSKASSMCLSARKFSRSGRARTCTATATSTARPRRQRRRHRSQCLRGDITWNVTDNLVFRFNYQTTRASSRSRMSWTRCSARSTTRTNGINRSSACRSFTLRGHRLPRPVP